MVTNYSFICRVGYGAYGIVFKGKKVDSSEVVAIKQINLKEDTKSQLDVFREISCLRNCEHDNIVHLREVLISSHTANLVMEFVESNLRAVIEDVHRPFNNQLIKLYFSQIFYGIAYLHHIGIMHRDIKPENILISTSNKVKIADFGLACLYLPDQPEHQYNHQVATRWYRAPELLFGSTNYNPKVDIWAVGCILVEFINNHPLFAGNNDIEQIVRVFQVLGTPNDQNWPEWELLPDSGKIVFEPIDAILDKEWKSLVSLSACADEENDCLRLIQYILQLNPSKRSTAIECLQSDFLSRNVPKFVEFYKPPSLEERAQKREKEIHFNSSLIIDNLNWMEI